MSNEMGELTETKGEVTVEWKIEIQILNTWCMSPVFSLSDACWHFAIAFDDNPSSGDLYLQRDDCGPPKTLSFTIACRKADGQEHVIIRKEGFTFANDSENKWFFLRKIEFVQFSKDLIVIACTLRSEEKHNAKVSLFRRLWNTSCSLKEILRREINTDIEVRAMKILSAAHRWILETRCPNFLRKVECEMKEDRTGGSDATVCDRGTLCSILNYMCCGELDDVSSHHVRSVYKFAHKYQLQDLKELCAAFIEKSLTIAGVCDVIKLANSYDDTGLKKYAKDFFAKNSSEILETYEWEHFKKGNSDLCIEILEHMMNRRLKPEI